MACIGEIEELNRILERLGGVAITPDTLRPRPMREYMAKLTLEQQNAFHQAYYLQAKQGGNWESYLDAHARVMTKLGEAKSPEAPGSGGMQPLSGEARVQGRVVTGGEGAAREIWELESALVQQGKITQEDIPRLRRDFAARLEREMAGATPQDKQVAHENEYKQFLRGYSSTEGQTTVSQVEPSAPIPGVGGPEVPTPTVEAPRARGEQITTDIPQVGRDYPPGFRNVPGGPEGYLSHSISLLMEKQDFLTDLDWKKRGKVAWAEDMPRAIQAIKNKEVTLGDILSWQPGMDPLISHKQIAAALIAEQTRASALELVEPGLRGEIDPRVATRAFTVSEQAMSNVAARMSEAARTLKTGQIAPEELPGPMAVISHIEPPPTMGGLDAIYELSDRLDESAGGARMRLEQIAMMPTKWQQAKLPSLWQRFKNAAWEYVYMSQMGPRTPLKIIRSTGIVTPAFSLAEHAIAEHVVRPFITGPISPALKKMAEAFKGRRILGDIAPHLADQVEGMTRGSTWNAFNGLLHGFPNAWQHIAENWRGLAQVARDEGIVKAEQQVMSRLKESFPEWSDAMKGMARMQPSITGSNFPEGPELMQRALDITGAVGRSVSTDLTAAAHAATYQVHFDMNAAVKAGELAMREGHRPGSIEYEAAKTRILNAMPDEVHAYAQEAAKRGTFIQDLHGPLAMMNRMMGHSLARLFTSPYIRFATGKLEYTLERTPIIQNLMPGWWEDLAAGGKRRDLAVSRVAVGWGLLYLIAQLKAGGYVTGSRPRKRDAQTAMDNAGVPAASYWNPATEKWNSAFDAEPLGDFITTFADWHDIIRDVPEPHWHDDLVALTVATGHAIFQQPVMVGVGEWMRIMAEKPDDAIRSTLLQMGRAIPIPMQGTIGTVYPYLDGVRKEARTLTDMKLRMLPGWDLHPRRNTITGEPLYIEGPWPWDLVNSFMSHTMTKDPVLLEAERLKGAGMMPLPWHLGGTSPPEYIEQQKPGEVPGVNLTDDQHNRWVTLMTQTKYGGKTLHEALSEKYTSRAYQGLPDISREAEFKKTYNHYRQASERKLLEEYPDLRRAVQQSGVERKIQRAPMAMQHSLRERFQAREPVVSR